MTEICKIDDEFLTCYWWIIRVLFPRPTPILRNTICHKYLPACGRTSQARSLIQMCSNNILFSLIWTISRSRCPNLGANVLQVATGLKATQMLFVKLQSKKVTFVLSWGVAALESAACGGPAQWTAMMCYSRPKVTQLSSLKIAQRLKIEFHSPAMAAIIWDCNCMLWGWLSEALWPTEEVARVSKSWHNRTT